MWNGLITLCFVSLLVGCQPPAAIGPSSPDPQTSDAEPTRRVTRTNGDAIKPAAKKDQETTSVPKEVVKRKPNTGVTRDPARVGVGRKGQGYGGGIISEPARQVFRIRERAIFAIQIPQALRTLKALDSRGQGPKTHEEFMEKVIKQNGIRLPELQPGRRYVYDPETETLMVERPSN